MPTSLGSILLGVPAVCFGLYLLVKILDRIDHYRIRRRRARIRKEAGGDSICRWGVNSAGELVQVRCKRTEQD